MKNSKEGFEQNISFKTKANRTLKPGNYYAVGRKIICKYYLNEEKGLQE